MLVNPKNQNRAEFVVDRSIESIGNYKISCVRIKYRVFGQKSIDEDFLIVVNIIMAAQPAVSVLNLILEFSFEHYL
uniref:Uncharacterized protein n=1 Tax=Romanomermis culicivorax TaxID=13658 RepID=A0A915JRR0_ROMCU